MDTVLVLASSPQDQGPLHLGKEHKLIKHSRDSAINREQWRVIECMATTVDDLRRYLLEHSPTIVHFCGHGAGRPGLCFEDDDGKTSIVSGERLAKLFHLMNEKVKCVVLNACYSEAQAKAFSAHIDFVIGMSDEIGDPAALKFAQGFYEAIWAGETYERAYKFGCSAINTAHIPEDHIPVILKSPRMGGSKLAYTEEIQTIENFVLRFMNGSPEEKKRLSVVKMWTASAPSHQDAGDDVDDDELVAKRVYSSVSVLRCRTVAKVYKEVTAILRSGLDATRWTYYLKSNGDSYLMDRQATQGYWPIAFNTFKAMGMGTPIRVRVIAELSDYYNFDYEPSNCFSIRLSNVHGQWIHGYIHHRNKDCDNLVRRLYDGKRHRMILEIIDPQQEKSVVTIVKVVSDSWIMPEGISEEIDWPSEGS